MFTRIARRYDLMNALMTAGRHHAWRRAAARAAVAAPPGPILDLATGTGDLARAVRRLDPARVVVGVDFAEAMLARARGKLPGVPLTVADALALPFADGAFAAVASAFLLRNLGDLPQGLREMRRVCRPGGRVVTLDIVRPRPAPWAALFGLYFHHLVPALGAVVAGDRRAYAYLPQSVARFVTPEALAELLRQAGLREVTWRTLGLGTVALHVGVA